MKIDLATGEILDRPSDDWARCIFCGQVTNAWWFMDRKNSVCRCSACYSKGIAETKEEKIFYSSKGVILREVLP